MSAPTLEDVLAQHTSRWMWRYDAADAAEAKS